MRRLFAGILLVLLSMAGASSVAGAGDLPYMPDTSYYFEHFDPEQKPWQPGQDLNIEEVFKNYEYFEVRFAKNGREIEVTRYIQNRREHSERYRIKSDGVLEKLVP